MGTRLRAETAGHLLLQLGHAHITLAHVVVEGDTQVGDEPQDLVAVVLEAGDQVVGWGLFDPAAAARGTRAVGVVTRTLGEDRVVAADEVSDRVAESAVSPASRAAWVTVLASSSRSMSRCGQGRPG